VKNGVVLQTTTIEFIPGTFYLSKYRVIHDTHETIQFSLATNCMKNHFCSFNVFE